MAPYKRITFLRFCVSSHHNITHGLYKPIAKKTNDAIAVKKKSWPAKCIYKPIKNTEQKHYASV